MQHCTTVLHRMGQLPTAVKFGQLSFNGADTVEQFFNYGTPIARPAHVYTCNAQRHQLAMGTCL